MSEVELNYEIVSDSLPDEELRDKFKNRISTSISRVEGSKIYLPEDHWLEDFTSILINCLSHPDLMNTVVFLKVWCYLLNNCYYEFTAKDSQIRITRTYRYKKEKIEE